MVLLFSCSPALRNSSSESFDTGHVGYPVEAFVMSSKAVFTDVQARQCPVILDAIGKGDNTLHADLIVAVFLSPLQFASSAVMFLMRMERIAKARLLTIAPANPYTLNSPSDTVKGSKDSFKLARTTPKMIGKRVAFTCVPKSPRGKKTSGVIFIPIARWNLSM